MAGFEARKTVNGDDIGNLEYFVVSNSEIITAGNAVRVNTLGKLENVAAGETIMGVAAETVTGDGTETCGVYAREDTLFYNDADGSLTQSTNSQAYVGFKFDLISDSQVDSSTVTTGDAGMQLMEIDPNDNEDASEGLFKIFEHQASR